MTTITIPEGYESLGDVLGAALHQASSGKGKERHGNGQPFDAQPMQSITGMVGIGFPLGQSIKKSQEALGMIARGDRAAARLRTARGHQLSGRRCHSDG